MKRTLAALAALLALAASGGAQAQTLDKIRQRGTLSCGTSQGLAGFSTPDAKGEWSGFDIDWCRALAAAIFDDPTKIRLIPLSSKDRLTAVQSGEVDVLARTTTWTLGREAPLGIAFTAVNYYDGQGFLVRRSLGVKSPKDLNGASICTAQGTTTELNLADYFRANGLKYEVVAFADLADVENAFKAGRCDAYTTDVSGLSAARLKMDKPDDFAILPDIISKEPDGAWVRKGDGQWFDIVRWTLFAMVDAEELGVTGANLKDQLGSTSPEVRRLLGVEGTFGEQLGLTKDWVQRIVGHVGNYGESFERNLGSGSPLKMERGPNRLWSRGGLQFAPPIR